jgi:AcrR family transcriptional regulator
MVKRPSKRRRTVEAHVREEQILDTAARLFREQGFAGTGLRQIAAEAGLLLGSVQYRFPTKESLLVALMERAVARATAAVRTAVEETRDPVDRVRLGLGAHLRVLLSGDDAVFVLLYDWRVLKGDAREAVVRLRDRYEAFWDGLLYEAAGAGRLRPTVDLRLLRLFGFGAINWVATWYQPGGAMTPDDIANVFFATMACGIVSDDERQRLLGLVSRPPSERRPASPRRAPGSRKR